MPTIQSPVVTSPSGVFISTLTALKAGKLLEQLDDMLREVTRAVGQTQLSGSVTLKLSISPNGVGVGDSPLFRVTPAPSRSVPQKAETAQSFFADEDSNLTRRNPDQGEMRLTAISDPPAVQPFAVNVQKNA